MPRILALALLVAAMTSCSRPVVSENVADEELQAAHRIVVIYTPG
ncbi:MAG: hypothetical protein V3W41_18255 [Planctomycetota bacterium]